LKKIIITTSVFLLLTSYFAFAQDWKALAKNLKADHQGKIIAVEQLNSSTVWAVLSSHLSNEECRKEAESIGFYVRNSTGGIRGEKPSVHVFKNGKHIATARPEGMNYVGKIDIENWDPSSFGGQYRP
jgi:hypothetical protein